LKYAAIDIGSNAIRLLIAEIKHVDGKTSFKKTSLIRVPLRLGDDAFINKKISEKKAGDFHKAMQAFKNLMDVYKVDDYRACATSAMREAKNGQKIVDDVKTEIGLEIEIVGGAREAEIIYASHIERNLNGSRNYLYIDVGGGSTELSVFYEGEISCSRSFNLGTIRILDNQDKDETWDEMKEWMKKNVRGLKLSAIGTGGNINKLFKLSDTPDGQAMSYEKLKKTSDYLKSYSLKDRINVLGLNRDRADVIIPAADIFLTVLKWSGVKEIYVPRVGMVDGIIQLLIEKNFKD